MSRGNLAWLLIVPALMLAGLIFAYSAPAPDQDYQMVRTVVDVLAEIDRNYYRELSPEQKKKLVEDMINGGLRSLDDHSQYFNEDALIRFEDESVGEFGGVGILMDSLSTDPHLVVATPMPGTPAYEAGIAPGDIILKIDGVSTEHLGHEAARKLIVGKPGTPVTFSLLRFGHKEPEDVTLIRAKIEQHAVYGYERDPKDPAKWLWFPDSENRIAMIRLERFNEKTTDELKAALDLVLDQGAKALILDLRGNPGGLLSEACKVSDLFLSGGEIVSTRNRDGKGKSHTAENNKNRYENAATLPMAVLIDRYSASASEIVAAALQDNGRAVLIGERTWGKGSVQKVYRLPPDEKRAVKLTSETWFTPSGRNIHRTRDMKDADQWGVLPNEGFAVKQSVEDLRKTALLRRKIDVIPGKFSPPAAAANESEGYQDPVLAKALEYLRKVLKK